MYLKQSTAAVISLGPFVAFDDGVTLETGLVSALDHASTGIMLSKNGGTLAVRHATVTASEYDAHGCYKVTLDTTDTGTLGRLRVIYTDATTIVPVWQDYHVVTANVYDSLLGSGDVLDVSMVQILGTAVSTPATAGILDVNLKNIADAAVSTSTAQLGVNAVNIGGTAQTGRDIGASVLISSGAGAGQLDVTSGVIKANLAQILGTALTETSGLIAAAFKKFFNVATPTGTVNSLPDAVAGAAGGVFIAGTNAATTVTTALTTTFTGNLTGSVGSVTGAVGSVTGAVGSVTGAVGSVTGSVGSLATQAKADVNAEVVDVLATDTYAESSGVPAATSTLAAAIIWLRTLARNKITQTATTQTLRNDADGASIATSTVSDDSVTFTRGKWS